MALRMSLPAAVAALAAIFFVPSVAAGTTVIAHGYAPDAVDDRDGITHVLYNQRSDGARADILRYCQIPAGATACTPTRAGTLRPAPAASRSSAMSARRAATGR